MLWLLALPLLPPTTTQCKDLLLKLSGRCRPFPSPVSAPPPSASLPPYRGRTATVAATVQNAAPRPLQIMGGHKYALSPDEYVFASLTLYLDIINILLYIMELLGGNRD